MLANKNLYFPNIFYDLHVATISFIPSYMWDIVTQGMTWNSTFLKWFLCYVRSLVYLPILLTPVCGVSQFMNMHYSVYLSVSEICPFWNLYGVYFAALYVPICQRKLVVIWNMFFDICSVQCSAVLNGLPFLTLWVIAGQVSTADAAWNESDDCRQLQ
jgi:hypothetical protein